MEAQNENRFIAFIYRRKNGLNILGLSIMAVMFLILFAALITAEGLIAIEDMLKAIGFLMTMVLSFVIGVCYGVGNYGGDKRRNIIYQLLILLGYSYAFVGGFIMLNMAWAEGTWGGVGYSLGAIFTILYIFLFCSYDQTFFHISRKAASVLFGIRVTVTVIFLVLLFTNGLTGIFYNISPAGRFEPGNIRWFWWIYALGFLILYSVLVILFVPDKRTRFPLLFAKVALLTWFIIDSVPNSMVRDSLVFVQNYATAISLLIIFCFIYIEGARKISRQKRELEESKLQALQLQMNPHLIYNTLSSIAALCRSDPEKTEELVYKFSDYLRDNFTDSERGSFIPFSEEIQRLKNYVAVEQQRFPRIKVEYGIDAIGFRIPAMTLQPLVENAIKHGICKRRKSEGTITIASKETDDSYIVTVEDDGVGFVKEQNNAEGKKRRGIGVDNTRRRLEILCDGTLELASTPGIGTISKVTIPKKSGGGINYDSNVR